MRFTIAAGILVLAVLLNSAGCRNEPSRSVETGSNKLPTRKEAGPLPDSGFKAQITLIDPPTKLRVGQKETVRLKVKNASDVQWYSRGGELNKNPDNRFYLAVGNRWLKTDAKTLVTNMDGRHGLQQDLKPGQEEEVSLQITAPGEPGDYVLELDVVQEQVSWFRDKGSAPAQAKITVVR